MSEKLKDILVFILRKYPERLLDEMSNARLTKMVYLSDWKHCLKARTQISDVNWYFDNFGPYVSDIQNTARENKDIFIIDLGSNYYGQPKTTFRLKDRNLPVNLNEDEKQTIVTIIDETKKLYWKEFIKLVYSTHPIVTSDKYNYVDLIEKSAEYQALDTNQLSI